MTNLSDHTSNLPAPPLAAPERRKPARHKRRTRGPRAWRPVTRLANLMWLWLALLILLDTAGPGRVVFLRNVELYRTTNVDDATALRIAGHFNGDPDDAGEHEDANEHATDSALADPPPVARPRLVVRVDRRGTGDQLEYVVQTVLPARNASLFKRNLQAMHPSHREEWIEQFETMAREISHHRVNQETVVLMLCDESFQPYNDRYARPDGWIFRSHERQP